MGLFEAADRGTKYLDKIGEMSVSMQAKLLRAIQEKEMRRVGEKASIPIDVRQRTLGRGIYRDGGPPRRG